MTARKSTLQLVLNLLTLLVLLAPLASPWALSQPAPVSAAPLPEEQNAPPLAASFDAWTDLFRAWVTLSQPTSRARLDTLGVVVLEETETQALILADGEQLETLARLRFQPQASEDLGMLVEHHAQATPWLAESLQPLLAQGRSARALSTDTGSHAGRVLNTRDAQALQQAQTDLRLTLQSLSIEQQAGIMNMTTIDSDGDGLTDTEEYWWCTDPLNPDTKGDGVSDGAAVAALMARPSSAGRWCQVTGSSIRIVWIRIGILCPTWPSVGCWASTPTANLPAATSLTMGRSSLGLPPGAGARCPGPRIPGLSLLRCLPGSERREIIRWWQRSRCRRLM